MRFSKVSRGRFFNVLFLLSFYVMFLCGKVRWSGFGVPPFSFFPFYFIKIVFVGENLWSLGGILMGYVVVMSDINGVL